MILPKRQIGHISCSLLMVLAILVGFTHTSCTKDAPADARDLIKTVPSDATAIALINVRAMLDKSGCKSDGASVKLSPEIESAVNSIRNSSVKDNIKAIFSGEAGVANDCCVLFMEGYDSYVTFMVNDPDKFKAFVEKQTGENFTSNNNVQTCGSFALAANQGWMRAGSNSAINGEEILKFTKLSDTQSFLSNICAEKMLEMKSDIEGWTDLNALVDLAGKSFQDRAVYRMILSSLFNDAAYATHEVNFDKGKVSLISHVLDSKGKIAKCNFSTSKVDPSTIENLGGAADLIFAISIDSKLSKQLQNIFASLAGGMGGVDSSLLKAIDGTAAAALSDLDSDYNLRAVVTTDGKSSVASLTELLSSFGTVKRDGKSLNITKGTPAGGDVELKEAAKLLKNAWLGCVIGKSQLRRTPQDPPVFHMILFTASPDQGGLTSGVQMFTGEDSNALLSMLKVINY